MSDIGTFNTKLMDSLLEARQIVFTQKTSDTSERIKTQMETLPSVLDESTLQKLKDGEYDITLKEYTNISTYRAKMNALYGNNSADSFQQNINRFLNNDNDKLSNAKSFIEKMKENGISNTSAVKLYSAIRSYSLISDIKNYSYVSAKI